MTKYRIGRIAACIVVACVALATASTEGATKFAVRGQILSPSPLVPTLMAELRSLDSPTPDVVLVDGDGTFVVFPRQQGAYSLRIIGSQGQVLWENIVVLNSPMQTVSIELPNVPDRAASAATISAAELSHKVPSAARKAFNKGLTAARKGNDRDALKYFRETLAIDPRFTDAYVELGGTLVAVGESADAIEQYQKAIELAPEHEIALFNLCVTLGKMQRWREAKDTARKSLSVDPGRPEIQFILGVGLMFDDGPRAEALSYLLKASREIPKARLLAADILRQLGRAAEEADQLKEYLRVAPPEDTEVPRVKSWLMQLQEQKQ